jgi:predicted O-methyltransferase YrrM
LHYQYFRVPKPVIARAISKLFGQHEIAIRSLLYQKYRGNPLRVRPLDSTREDFEQLGRVAAEADYSQFQKGLMEQFGSLPEKYWIDDLALLTQVVKKEKQIVYQHGHLLYAALRQLAESRRTQTLTILETGTARGFSAVCMAKALADAGACGKVLTIDVLPHDRPIYWNCISDCDGPATRAQLLSPYSDLVEESVVFIQGRSDAALSQLSVPRIDFAFLDAAHDYSSLLTEFRFVERSQRPGDLIVIDDYSKEAFPGVVRAVDEIVDEGAYDRTVFEISHERGYCVCRRLH